VRLVDAHGQPVAGVFSGFDHFAPTPTSP
jgi:hypothetical protein